MIDTLISTEPPTKETETTNATAGTEAFQEPHEPQEHLATQQNSHLTKGLDQKIGKAITETTKGVSNGVVLPVINNLKKGKATDIHQGVALEVLGVLGAKLRIPLKNHGLYCFLDVVNFSKS
jgi:hypothetical protein